MGAHRPKPEWLRKHITDTPERRQLDRMFDRLGLHTVCREAGCPNRVECFTRKTAAFLILGKNCTRACAFCGVDRGAPLPPDCDEPGHVAQAAAALGLAYAVITSVTRDDLEDGGAAHFAAVIAAVRLLAPPVTVEALVPDFRGDPAALRTVLSARPEVLNHNVETVPRLYPQIRPQADFKRSLLLLESVKTEAPKTVTKSGIIVGLGEDDDEIAATLRELRKVGCDIVTIGQYLPPSRAHLQVRRFVTPHQFEEYRSLALDLGFSGAFSGPFVRSSYHAAEIFRAQKTAQGAHQHGS